MFRTQIYLTEAEKAGLDALARETGKKQSELIRQAIDEIIVKKSRARNQKTLQRAAGLWKNRRDLPDFGKLRREWDR
ncbi:MAG: ribbon-helix-helix domain-containing protein [Burkholderiales bacterium]